MLLTSNIQYIKEALKGMTHREMSEYLGKLCGYGFITLPTHRQLVLWFESGRLPA